MKEIIRSIYFKVAVAFMSVYTLFGFVLLPYLIQTNFSKIIKQNLNTNGYLGKVYINPYSFEIELDNLLINDAKNNTLVYFRTLNTNLRFTKLLGAEIYLDHIKIDDLKLSVDIYKDKKFNFSHILEHLEKSASKESSKPKEGGNSVFILEKLDLNGARVAFSDDTKSKKFILNSKSFDLDLDAFSTIPNTKAVLNTSISFIDTLALNLSSNIGLNPLNLDGKIDIENIKLLKIYEYLADDLEFEFKGDIKKASAAFNVDMNEILKAKVDDLKVDLRSFEYSDPKFLAALNDLGINIKTIDLKKDKELELKLNGDLVLNSVDIGSKKAQNPFELETKIKDIGTFFDLDMKGGKIVSNIDDLKLAVEKTLYDDKKFNALTKDINLSIKNIDVIKDEKLDFDLTKISVKNKITDIKHLEKSKDKVFDIKDLSLDIDKFSSDKSISSNITLSLDTPKKGDIKFKGDLLQESMDLKGGVIINSFVLDPYKHYIRDFINIDLKSAAIDTKLNLHIKESEQNARGELKLSNLDIYHALTNKRLLKLNSFDLKGIEYKNNDLYIKDVLLDDFYAIFKIAADKSTNIDGLMVLKEGESNKSKETLKTEEKTEPFNYHIKNLKLTKGKTEFSDHSLPLNFDTNIHSLEAELSDISSKNKETEIKLKGVVEEYGLADIQAKTVLKDFKDKTDVAVSFENLNITSLSPYSGKFIGRKISEGRLWLDLNYNIIDSQLSSTNRIRIKDIALGKDVNSSDAMDLPIELAIALLEDSSGMIDLNIPVTGDIENPQFQLGGAIGKAIANVIINIVTAPFRFLGSLLGLEGDELGSVEFRYGYADILPPQKEKLDKLAKLLNDKKALALTIDPSYEPSKDALLLKEQKYEEMVKSENKEETIKKLYLTMFGKESFDKIAKKFKKEENNKLLAELETALKATVTVSEDDLKTLAQKRAENLKNYFISKKLDTNRVNIKDKIVVNENNNTKEIPIKLELNAKGN